MEGLLIAEELRRLQGQLGKRLAWRFLDAQTFILPLARGALWLFNKPPNPRLSLTDDLPSVAGPHTGFQDLLVAKAMGRLEHASQLKLDRVLRLEFGSGEGFVPTPPVSLVFELTGRNCNLILLDEQGIIMGAARDIGTDVNRFRQVRAGLAYQPPPPYDKLDPRSASEAALREVLAGQRLKKIRSLVDGFGPELTRALAVTSGVGPERLLEPANLDRVIPVLDRIAKEPSEVVRESLGLPDVAVLREREARAAKLERLRTVLAKERTLTQKKLEDIDKARKAAQKADALRAHADVLMAYAHTVPDGATSTTLTDFEGNTLELQLDARYSAVENAQAMYERARKRETRAVQAETREDQLKTDLVELEGFINSLDSFDARKLNALLERFAPKKEKQFRAGPGIRYEGPHGFTILVGRNSRDNDVLTTRIAKSRDVWLHVQGYRGSHVIVQAKNKEVPFDTILYAAQLAAAYSKASQSDNVPVDYTLRKNVWKVKGGAAGAVHYTQQKTVYVTPDRSPELNEPA